MMRRSTVIGVFFATLALRAETSWACATCFGAEGDPQTEGLNMAIITLLSVTYSLFAGMALTAFLCWKKNSAVVEGEVGMLEPSPLEEAPTING